MSWCPKCKNEYRDGFAICVDCGTKLIDKIDESSHIKIAYFSNDEICDKFKKYLDYSKISYYYELIDETNYITVDEKQKKPVIKALKAFINVEAEYSYKIELDDTYFVYNLKEVGEAILEEVKDSSEFSELKASMDDEISDEEKEKLATEAYIAEVQRKMVSTTKSTVYESKSYKAEEMSSSGYILILFGIVGVAFMALNFAGILKIFALGFSSVILLCMFLVMIVGGIFSIKSSKKYAKDAESEEEFTKKFKDWLKENVKPEDVKGVDLDSNSPEENAFLRYDFIKAKVYEEFGAIDENFVDNFIEEYYNEYIDD